MTGLVSIIVPAHNRANLIGETLESIAAQTYRPLECLIIDDGSVDGTADVAGKWGATHTDPASRVVRFSRNSGKCAAVNQGLSLANGEFVMVLDSDDILMPEAIAREVEYLQQHPAAGAVFGKAFVIDGSGKTHRLIGCFSADGPFDDLTAHYGSMVVQGNAIIASTVLMRMSIVHEVGEWRNDLRHMHDLDYWVRLAARSSIGFLGLPVLYYRVNVHGSISSNRVGTFDEVSRWLAEPGRILDRSQFRKVILSQTKYFAWLSYHQGEPFDMLRIGLHGLWRCLFPGGRQP
jgi:glycosyltransferase involved in cell wall biosynthesis